MEIIYVDIDYKCHATNPDGVFREVETDFFSGKCQEFIEGYCYDDSKGYAQIYPGNPYSELEKAQREYERALIADMRNALNKLGVTVDE